MRIETTDLAGGAYRRGVQHGQGLKARVRGHLAAWLHSLEQAGLGEGEAYVGGLLRNTDFRTAISLWAPELLEEVDGVADGADLPRDLVFALQLLDEEWAYRVRRQATSAPLEKCSSFAVVTPDGPTWIGQNMDLGGYTDGWQTTLRLAPDGNAPGVLAFSAAGLIGLMGVNAAGVAVCVNSLPQLPSAAEGVPVAFVLRRLLQCRDLAEASDLVLAIPHATNQHYVIAQAGAARSFEAGAAGVTEYHPPDPARILHTNHPLGKDTGRAETEAQRENTVARLASLERRLSAGRPGLREVEAALAAFDDPRHPVCRLRSGDSELIGFTTGSMISALRPGQAPVESWISAGPPSLGGYSRFELARDVRAA
jgi:hypothetical protein